MPERRIATLDIGTNTLLLLVAEVRPGEGGAPTLVPLYEACEFGRLGKGLDKTGVLDDGAIERSVDIVTAYRAKMDELGVACVHAVGTQALREAANAAAFVDRATAILGAPIEVIAGEREAELVYRAVANSLPQVAGRQFAIADVGGGSTEIIVSTPDGAGLLSATSVPIGSVRLHERHLADDPPTAAQVAALIGDIDQALALVELPRGGVLVASAGTATTMAAMEMHMRVYDPKRVHGHAIPRPSVERQLALLLEKSVAERRDLAGLAPQRADVIAAGVAIFTRLLHHMDVGVLVVNDRGVRWGVAYEMAATCY